LPAWDGRVVNASSSEPHATDKSNQLIFWMDLMPLVADETKDIAKFTREHIDRFNQDVQSRLNKQLGRI